MEKLVMAVVAIQLGIPFAGWAGKTLFGFMVKRQDAQDKTDHALSNAMTQITAEMRSGFKETQGLINQQNIELAELKVTVKHLQKEVDSHSRGIARLTGSLETDK